MLWVGRLERWHGDFGSFGGLGATSKQVESVNGDTPGCLDDEANLELRRCYVGSRGAFPATLLTDLTRKDLSAANSRLRISRNAQFATLSYCDKRPGVPSMRRKWIGILPLSEPI